MCGFLVAHRLHVTDALRLRVKDDGKTVFCVSKGNDEPGAGGVRRFPAHAGNGDEDGQGQRGLGGVAAP